MPNRRSHSSSVVTLKRLGKCSICNGDIASKKADDTLESILERKEAVCCDDECKKLLWHHACAEREFAHSGALYRQQCEHCHFTMVMSSRVEMSNVMWLSLYAFWFVLYIVVVPIVVGYVFKCVVFLNQTGGSLDLQQLKQHNFGHTTQDSLIELKEAAPSIGGFFLNLVPKVSYYDTIGLALTRAHWKFGMHYSFNIFVAACFADKLGQLAIYFFGDRVARFWRLKAHRVSIHKVRAESSSSVHKAMRGS